MSDYFSDDRYIVELHRAVLEVAYAEIDATSEAEARRKAEAYAHDDYRELEWGLEDRGAAYVASVERAG